MSNYLSPGVYVEEVSSGIKPIAGVGTSTGAFVGIAEKGVIGKAKLITNWAQYVKEFGGFLPNCYLAYAAFGFFAEGGTSCYVVRTCHYQDYLKPETKLAKTSTVTLLDDDDKGCLRILAATEGTWADQLYVKSENASAGNGFKLTVFMIANPKTNEQLVLEFFDNLTIMTVESIINNTSSLIRVEKDAWEEGGSKVIGSGKTPKIKSGTGTDQKDYYIEKLSGGNDGVSDDNGASLMAYTDFIGDENAQNGLHAFDVIDGINIVAIPDSVGNFDVTNQALTYCKNRKDCFFVADAPAGKKPTEIKAFKTFSSSYGALYYPWVEVNDPINGKRKLVPPSGVVAGTYAYTDSNRGVHKAPAGIGEGYLDSVVGLEAIITKGEHDLLNPVGINVIRPLAAGICIWGARTLSADTEWLYINVRRLLMYIEKSLDKGTQWVVFEPNTPGLWNDVKRNLTAFLTRVWRDGALFGSTSEEAFFVKVDAENNPPAVRDLGQLIIEVGVAPVKPAEFVIIKISQKTLIK